MHRETRENRAHKVTQALARVVWQVYKETRENRAHKVPQVIPVREVQWGLRVPQVLRAQQVWYS